MQNIHFKVEGQRIENTSDVVVVAKSKHEYKAVFSFSSEWEALENKVAYFKTPKLKEPVFVELQDNECEIPVEALETPYFTVSVAAGDLRTATVCDVVVEETGYSDAAEPALSPKGRRRYADSLNLNGKQLQLTEAGTPIGEIVTIPDFDKFELWNDITIEEDVASISMSKTDDGKPLNIKKLFVIFTGKAKEKSSLLVLRFNGSNIYQMWNTFSRNDAETDFTIWMFAEKIAPGVFLSRYSKTALSVTNIDAIQGLSNANSEVGSALSRWAKQNAGSQKATSWNFGATIDLYKLRTGSRILVWGVQDDD